MPVRHAIGIDVGGTKIAGAIVDVGSGAVTDHAVVATDTHRGGEAVLADAVAMSRKLEAQAVTRSIVIEGVGVCIAELVDPDGSITSSQSFDWRPLDAAEVFSDSVPVLIQSDVIAAALAESLFGAGKDQSSFLYVSVGTGISSSFVIDGEPWVGANGNAIILASGSIPTRCEACGAESKLVPEQVASGRGLIHQYVSRSDRTDIASAAEVIAVAEAGDKIAQAVVVDAGHMLGALVAFAVNILDPHRIVVGGGLGTAGGSYWDSFVASLRAHVWAEEAADIEVVKAALGSRSGMIGAAAGVVRGTR
ncbi:MAG: ROK family protein [Acidimicrobiia bacterium]|nr:MAG: ROK family protein [Acidimicrobiia bacterium]